MMSQHNEQIDGQNEETQTIVGTKTYNNDDAEHGMVIHSAHKVNHDLAMPEESARIQNLEGEVGNLKVVVGALQEMMEKQAEELKSLREWPRTVHALI